MPGVRQTATGVVQTAAGVSRTALSSVTMIDSFEDGDISEYGDGDGTLSAYAVTQDSTVAVDGDYYLEATDASFHTVFSETGLNAYPQQGDEWNVWMRVDDAGSSNSYAGHYFGTGNDSDEYWTRIRPDSNEFNLDLANGTTLSASATIDLATWYRIRHRWDDGSTFGGNAGDITATLFDASDTQLAELSGNDTQYSSGGIGWFHANILHADYAHITNR